MAATTEGRRLTEAHRLAQNRLARQVTVRLAAVYPLLNPDDLASTVNRWLAAAVPIVQNGRTTSARLSANYLTVFRGLELGVEADTAPVVLAETVPRSKVATSLIVTGVAPVRAGLARARPRAKLLDIARARSAGAGMRHALDGGRETILETVRNDPDALGWARAASGNACAFCAMLASRGPVFSDGSGDFQAHDHCNCGVEPVYRHDADWPSGSRAYADIYAQAKADDGDTLANFRQALST